MLLLRRLLPNSETDCYKDCAPTEHGFGFLKPEPERRSRLSEPRPDARITQTTGLFGLLSQELVRTGINYCGIGCTGLL
jgi:hypothetical protein